MIRKCKECSKIYDDFDHLTICPHKYFPSGKAYEELVTKELIKKYITFVDLDLK